MNATIGFFILKFIKMSPITDNTITIRTRKSSFELFEVFQLTSNKHVVSNKYKKNTLSIFFKVVTKFDYVVMNNIKSK